MPQEKTQRKIEHETLREMQKAKAMMFKVEPSNQELKQAWEALVGQAQKMIDMQQIIFDNEKTFSDSNTVKH
jgi:hypothetical protein